MTYGCLPLGAAYMLSFNKTPLERDIYRFLIDMGREVDCTKTFPTVDWNKVDSLVADIENGLSAYGEDGRLYRNFLGKWESEKMDIKIARKS